MLLTLKLPLEIIKVAIYCFIMKALWRTPVWSTEGNFLSDFCEHWDSIYQANASTGHACYFIQTHIAVTMIIFIVNEAERYMSQDS
jgi:hypothetical protein